MDLYCRNGWFYISFCCLVKVWKIAGIDNNETIQIHGAGGDDPEANQPGDLFVAVKVEVSIT